VAALAALVSSSSSSSPGAHIVRHLENRLSACRVLPTLHSHQITAYERLLELARGAADAGEYDRELAARDLTLVVVRAEWLDRYHNAACVYAALGDEAQRRAAAARFHAGSQRDFLAAITATEHQYAAGIAAARASQEALAPLLTSLLDWRIADEGELRQQRLGEVRGLWSVIQASDPGCTWERICSHPPYRDRIPFDGEGLALLGEWLAQALAGAVAGSPEETTAPGSLDELAGPAPDETAAGSPGEPGEPAEPAPDATTALAEPGAEPAGQTSSAWPGPAHAYRLTYEAQDWTGRDRTRHVYERILALEAEVLRGGGPAASDAFLCRMAEEGLLDDLARAPHLDWAADLRAHCAGRSQPALAHHGDALATAIAACPTAIAVEHERMRLDACFHIESAWDQIFVHYALCPILVVLAGDAFGGATAVREAAAATTALFGATWDTLLDTPRVWELFCRELVPAMFGRRPAIGAHRGEAGAAIAQAAAGFAPAPASDAPAHVRDHVTALVHAAAGTAKAATIVTATATALPGRGRTLVLWGQPVTLDAIADRLAAPPRPAIALDAAGATAMSALYVPHPP
jgi:hypothetical protein